MTSGNDVSDKDIRSDARDLNRGVFINMVGYVLKAAHPLLLMWVVRLYGAEAFGVFTLAQAVMMLAMRVVLVGMDKAVLWWVPRQEVPNERLGLGAVLLLSGSLATLLSLGIAAFGTPLMTAWNGAEAASALQLMILGLLPMTLMELLVHAVLGKRQMGARVLVKETLVPLGQVAASVGLFFAGFEATGLSIAYLAANTAGMVFAYLFFRHAFRQSREWGAAWPPPQPVVKYALPMWATELINSFAMRMDVYLLASLADASVLGVYAAVTQIGNTLRAIRQSFDPIVVALFSQISSRADAARLKAGFSRATVMVMVTQMPVYAFLFAFTKWLMPLFGEGFETGTDAVLILAGAGVLNGILGLNGLVLVGYGRSDLILMNLFATMALQAALLWLLIPAYEVTGAALAMGLTTTLASLLQWWQASRVAGMNPYNTWVPQALGGAALASGAMALTWLALSGAGEAVQRVAAFLAFLAVGGALLYQLKRYTPGLAKDR